MSTTDTRAAFEAWAAKEHPEAHHIIRDDGQYKHGGMRDWWPCWQAATEAAKATGTAGEQTKQSFENIEELPALPMHWAEFKYLGGEWAECGPLCDMPAGSGTSVYTDDQMREYGQACAEAARQPAQVAAVKTWQERVTPEFHRYFALHGYGPAEGAMMQEIADLRAAIAATNRGQP